MRPFQSTIPLADAQALLAAAAAPLAGRESVPLDDAGGRVLAEDVVAAMNVPPFERAMMDGYAVRAADTSGASRDAARSLAVVGRVFTGEILSAAIAPGECAEIATGAPLPAGADAVVMVEETSASEADPRRRAGRAGTGAAGPQALDDADRDRAAHRTDSPEALQHVQVYAAVAPGQHVGRAGADIAAGAVVARRGEVLLPARLGALAAVGRTDVPVVARPRVAIVSTGNEVVAPGRPLGPAQIHDVNRTTLAAVVAAHGGVPVTFEVAADSLDALHGALDRTLTCDVIVFSGGSSVGDRDLLIDVLQQRGEVIFHGIATRPGKPTAFGRIGGVRVFGMPGNPTSCLTNAYVLLVPFLRRLAHLPPHRPHVVRAPLARRVTSGVGRHQFYTVRLVDGRAEPAFKASGDITSMAHADGYIEISADTSAVEAGTHVDVVLF